jgi:hypothetical protein
MPDMSEQSSRERTKRIKKALSWPMTLTLCPIRGHICSSEPPSQLSRELRSAAGSCQTIRQHVAAVGRRVSTLCKGEDGLRQQVAVFHCSYNFCVPHASVRRLLSQPEPAHGCGSATQWRPCTPAMAAGLTDHVWTLREVLLFRVPPWPQPAGV